MKAQEPRTLAMNAQAQKAAQRPNQDCESPSPKTQGYESSSSKNKPGLQIPSSKITAIKAQAERTNQNCKLESSLKQRYESSSQINRGMQALWSESTER